MIFITETDPIKYRDEFNRQVSEYLRNNYSDGPDDLRIILGKVMKAGRGQLNPNLVIPIIKSFLNCDNKHSFNYE
jgi:Asp-tRNA(Asn)/Glu-tRNA(Gln) amidotransferase B subunit